MQGTVWGSPASAPASLCVSGGSTVDASNLVARLRWVSHCFAITRCWALRLDRTLAPPGVCGVTGKPVVVTQFTWSGRASAAGLGLVYPATSA